MMNRRLFIALAAAVLAGLSVRAGIAPFREGDRVVFLGDSITHGGRYVADLQYFWSLRNPGRELTLVNCGICGNRAADGISRFSWDVIPERPNRVFILFGMNDVFSTNAAVRSQVWNPAATGTEVLAARREVVETYRRNLRTLIGKCREIGAAVTLLTPTPYDQYNVQIGKRASVGANEPGLVTLAAEVRALAAEEHVEFVEFHKVLTPILRANPHLKFLSDRVHPHGDGHLLMAALVFEAMGTSAEFDGAMFDASDGKRSFTYSPSRLPLPANDDYRQDDRLYPITERMNREIIRIVGLPAGAYLLKAGGCGVGTYSAAELAQGVNIATLDTPSQRKALEGVSKVVVPLKKLAGRLRGLPQGYVQVMKRGGDIDDRESCFAKLDEWVDELRARNEENGHYYRYYKAEAERFKELYPNRESEKARLQNLRKALIDWCRPEPFEIAVEPAPGAPLVGEDGSTFRVPDGATDDAYSCVYAPKAVHVPVHETCEASGFSSVLKGLEPEIVTIKGLADGAYNLWLGNIPFGEYSAAEFEKGVNIGRTATHSAYAVMSPSVLLASRKWMLGESGEVVADPYPITVRRVEASGAVPDFAGKSRAQLLKVFEDNVFGVRSVERPPEERFVQLAPDCPVFGGLGVKRSMKAVLGDGKGKSFDLRFTAYLPAKPGRHPSFVLITSQNPDEVAETTGTRRFPRLPAQDLVRRGYAGISLANGDCAFDTIGKEMTNGVWAVFGPTGKTRTQTSWGAISAWAWGASRVMDWIETCPELDAGHVGVVGLSRCGKTALWAGATDERFALTVSCCSGCGGAKLNRAGLPASEHFVNLKAAQPHWFCKRFYGWADKEASAPFDMHWLVALCAPRLVLIASASDDNWAGPSGEFMSGVLASPAWELLGKKGLVAPRGYPPPAIPLQEGSIGYHRRIGGHGQTPYDWQRYMDFADAHGWK